MNINHVVKTKNPPSVEVRVKKNVPTKGIEPSHPCEWQILSLLRLPIPPHGQKSFLFGAAILQNLCFRMKFFMPYPFS
jgi:hypothetical protein